MSAVVVVGAQWGDEGKAKIIDLLAESAAVIVRYQGGCNAGHTVVCKGETFKFHLIPSGILYPDKICILGPGTVIYPDVLKQELDHLTQKGYALTSFYISPKAHITLPCHVALDGAKEAGLGDSKIGTTKRGIGPTYEDKVSRIGLRVGDLLLPDDVLKIHLEKLVTQKNAVLTQVYQLEPLSLAQLVDTCQAYQGIVAPYVANTDQLLQKAQASGQPILLEGAQGTMLDLDHGTYPYVTSSNPTSGGACTGSGLSPKAINTVIGVCKVYTTRVGEGPFPTELFDETGEHIAKVGVEFGTTTRRSRRCGWFDGVAMRYAAHINGFDGLAITKLDVFDGLPELKLCVAYKHKETGAEVTDFPSHIYELAQYEPVYKAFPGWSGSVREVRSYEQLPQEAKDFLQGLSECVNVPIAVVSVGPDREETIVCQKIMEMPTPARI